MRRAAIALLLVSTACVGHERHQEGRCFVLVDAGACPSADDLVEKLQRDELCGEKHLEAEGPVRLDGGVGAGTCCYLVTSDRSFLPFCE